MNTNGYSAAGNMGYQPQAPQQQRGGYYSNGNMRPPALSDVANRYGQNQSPITPLTGRMIDSDNDIVPSEIPLDGTVCFFAMRDLSAIYAKQIDKDFVMTTVRYVPYVEPPKENPSDSILQEISNRLSAIEKRLNQKPVWQKNQQKTQPQVTDKEVSE